jgi:hypothetical protein
MTQAPIDREPNPTPAPPPGDLPLCPFCDSPAKRGFCQWFCENGSCSLPATPVFVQRQYAEPEPSIARDITDVVVMGGALKSQAIAFKERRRAESEKWRWWVWMLSRALLVVSALAVIQLVMLLLILGGTW